MCNLFIIFFFTIKQFAQATIKSLRNRFPDSNEVPNNRDGLDTYGENE
jgi:hypothetical protein